jgi:hypothetical protein
MILLYWWLRLLVLLLVECSEDRRMEGLHLLPYPVYSRVRAGITHEEMEEKQKRMEGDGDEADAAHGTNANESAAKEGKGTEGGGELVSATRPHTSQKAYESTLLL